ncbi:MFS transporter [Streptomyces sviceus]|uniref:MFS transporter n=1 Tax=Streptomyces sviceus TaxID=285530 RepID=UPI0037F1FCB4
MTLAPPPKAPASPPWVLVLTAVAALVVALDQLVVATALQTIHRDLGASMTSLEWTVNAFSLSFAALMIPGAELGDRVGRKRTYILGLFVFALASAACALAPNIGLLIAARVLQGAGGAMISPAALALLTAAAPPHKHGAVMGVYAAVMGLAVVVGPLVGGVVTQGLAWQWIFWINVPVIAAVIPFAAAKLTEMKGKPVAIDYLGILLVAASMFGLVWALVRSGPAGWGSGEVLFSAPARRWPRTSPTRRRWRRAPRPTWHSTRKSCGSTCAPSRRRTPPLWRSCCARTSSTRCRRSPPGSSAARPSSTT